MTGRLPLLVALVALGGCLRLGLREPNEEDFCGDGTEGKVRCAAYSVLQCSTKSIEVLETSNYWRATGCGREVHCDTERRNWVCHPVPSSLERAKGALSLQTGCATTLMTVQAQSPAGEGYENFRLGACGSSWVCNVTEASAQCSAAAIP